MGRLVFVALAALLASPGLGASGKGDIGATFGAPIDMLYPEISVDDDGWRGLLPIILYNIDELAVQPQPGTSARRSERDEGH